MAGIVRLRPDAPVRAGDAQSFLVGDLAPLVVVRPAHDAPELVGHVRGAAHAVLVGVVLQDVLLHVLAPPVRTLAGDLHAQPIQAMNPAVVKAAFFMHRQGLSGGRGVVHHVAFLHHLRLVDVRGDAGRQVVEVRVAVGVVLHDELTAHAHAKAVVGVQAVLALLVPALHHAVGLVVDVIGHVLPLHAFRGSGVLVAAGQVPALIVGVLPVAGADGVGDDAALLVLVQLRAVVQVLVAQVTSLVPL